MSSHVSSVTERPLPQVDLKGHTVEELAFVANVSVDAIKRAIALRQKQLIAEQEGHLKQQMAEDANLRQQQQETEIANQLAMYQYEHQQYLATSTPPTSVRTTKLSTTTTTTTARQTTARKVPTTPRPIMAGGSKVCVFFQF